MNCPVKYSLPNPKLWIISVYSSKSLVVLCFTFRSMIHFEITVCHKRFKSRFFGIFAYEISDCTNTICWKKTILPLNCLCLKSGAIIYKCVCVCVCVYTYVYVYTHIYMCVYTYIHMVIWDFFRCGRVSLCCPGWPQTHYPPFLASEVGRIRHVPPHTPRWLYLYMSISRISILFSVVLM
jgi:hypothetical protein